MGFLEIFIAFWLSPGFSWLFSWDNTQFYAILSSMPKKNPSSAIPHLKIIVFQKFLSKTSTESRNFPKMVDAGNNTNNGMPESYFSTHLYYCQRQIEDFCLSDLKSVHFSNKNRGLFRGFLKLFRKLFENYRKIFRRFYMIFVERHRCVKDWKTIMGLHVLTETHPQRAYCNVWAVPPTVYSQYDLGMQ